MNAEKEYNKFNKAIEALSVAYGAKANCKYFPDSVIFCDDDLVTLSIEHDAFFYMFPKNDSIGVRFSNKTIKNIRRLQKIMKKISSRRLEE